MKNYLIISSKTKKEYIIKSDCMDDAIKKMNKYQNDKSFGNCSGQVIEGDFDKNDYIVL